MALRLEWRSRTEGDDTILAVQVEDGRPRVVKSWPADIDILTDLLNEMVGLDDKPGNGGNGMDYSQRSPQDWGNLVISRSDEGDVLYIDPALYWEGIAFWFRSRGRDPHPYHAP